MASTLKEMAAKLQADTQREREELERKAKPVYPAGAINTDNVFVAPHIRTGEDPMTSRPFMLPGVTVANLAAHQSAVDCLTAAAFDGGG